MRNENIWIATNYEGIVRINLQDKTYKRYAVGQKRDVQEYLLPVGRFPSADLGQALCGMVFLTTTAGRICL